MLDILLCGAGDTAEVRDEFVRVVSEFGGTPLHYLSGDILYVNTATATWAENSRASVQSSELCVFVIVRALGSITWTTEFREVVTSGKPFVMLCLDSTYHRYLELSQAVRSDGEGAAGPGDQQLLETLATVERDHQVTIVPFPANGFGEVLRRQLANTFTLALQLLETQNRRRFLRTLFHAPESLPAHHLEWATELALDETEEKGPRKQAIVALALRRSATEDVALALLGSPEQGVQRLAFARLADLYIERPPRRDFLEAVVEIANTSDDVGVARRLLPTLFDMDLATALAALTELNLTDSGLRRRLIDQLELHEGRIGDLGLVPAALRLAERARVGTDEQDWKKRLTRFIERHADDGT
ncbi:hypothetical protein RB608_09515 [Nocardioides sp. LHD-245]|uniref:hypothetical protein n=1 Tax=Nocardioides sp. LHD-245 TaxID=3051387 RepID=UPI0027E135B0|nr:hypothetical protein [Nocardioides sp. LHD-245]